MTAILKKRRWEAGFMLLLALAAAFLVQKFAGTYPVVFADEMHYSRLARLVPLPEVTIPSYLYLSRSASPACAATASSIARAT